MAGKAKATEETKEKLQPAEGEQTTEDQENQQPEGGDQQPAEGDGDQPETGEGEGENQQPETGEGDEPEGGEDDGADQEQYAEDEDEEEDCPKKLVAVYPILYLSHQYKVGDTLPANDPAMLAAWLEAGTAAWVDDVEAVSAKAKSKTAIPGLPGSAVSSEATDGDNLAGRIPSTEARKTGRK